MADIILSPPQACMILDEAKRPKPTPEQKKFADLLDNFDVERLDDEDATPLGTFTPLGVACRQNHPDIVQLLLSRGADRDGADKVGITPLAIACRYKHLQVAQLLLTQGADPNKPDCRGDTPVWDACHQGNVEVVQLLLGQGADPNKANKEGQTPIWIASCHGKVEVVRLLLDLEGVVDKNKVSREGAAPLWAASSHGHIDVVRLLLDRGADKDKHTNVQTTPLAIASLAGHVAVVQLLLDQGADPNKPDNLGRTPLAMATRQNYIEVVRLLLAGGADPDRGNNIGTTPLALACLRGPSEMVQILLEAGADPVRANDEGDTPLSFAVAGGHHTIVEKLVDALTAASCDRPLQERMGTLRRQANIMAEVAQVHAPSHVSDIVVRRDDIIYEFCSLANETWAPRINVRFENEQACGDGLRREYLSLMARELSNPEVGLLQTKCTEGDHAYHVQPCPESGVATEDHLSYFLGMGKLIGVSLMHGECFPCETPPPLPDMSCALTCPALRHVLHSDMSSILPLPLISAWQCASPQPSSSSSSTFLWCWRTSAPSTPSSIATSLSTL